MNNKAQVGWIILVILLLIGGVFLYKNPQIFKTATSSHTLSIQTVTQNISAYYNKTITVSGKVVVRGLGDTLVDSNGYWILLDNSCKGGNRDYNYDSQIYSATGTVYLKSSPSLFGSRDDNVLRCSSPLS